MPRFEYNPKEVLGYDSGDYVKYNGCSDDQFRYGGGSDPRNYLTVNSVYKVSRVHIGDWHSDVYLDGYDDNSFNSVCFVPCDESGKLLIELDDYKDFI